MIGRRWRSATGRPMGEPWRRRPRNRASLVTRKILDVDDGDGEIAEGQLNYFHTQNNNSSPYKSCQQCFTSIKYNFLIVHKLWHPVWYALNHLYCCYMTQKGVQSGHLTGWWKYVRRRRKKQAPLPQYIRILNFSSTYTYFGVHRVKNTELVVGY